jgi:hypothetical protein
VRHRWRLPNLVYRAKALREVERMIEIGRLCPEASETSVRRADLAQWDGLVLKLCAGDESVQPAPAIPRLAAGYRSQRLAPRHGASPAAGPCRNVWMEADLERLIADLRAFARRLTIQQQAKQTMVPSGAIAAR